PVVAIVGDIDSHSLFTQPTRDRIRESLFVLNYKYPHSVTVPHLAENELYRSWAFVQTTGTPPPTQLTIRRATASAVRPTSASISSREACSRYSCGTARSRSGTSTSASRNAAPSAAPNPPCLPLSSTVTTIRCVAASSVSSCGTGITHRGSTTVAETPCSLSSAAAATPSCPNAPTAT